jgi:hypothetical protein
MSQRGTSLTAQSKTWQTVTNSGDGSCFVHSCAHCLGMLRWDSTDVTAEQDRCTRLHLCDYAVKFVTARQIQQRLTQIRDTASAKRIISEPELTLVK